MANVWRCQRVRAGVKCATLNPRVKRKCTACGAPRPAKRQPAHRAVLDELPYEWWAERFGELCNICGAEPGTRRLHRDHDHGTGEPRGLLCHRCNRGLPNWAGVDWLRAAADYLLAATTTSDAPNRSARTPISTATIEEERRERTA
jgi:hypothetical protein